MVSGFIPPPSPSASATEIAAFYADDVDLNRIGVLLFSVGGSLFLPFGVAVATQRRRIEGPVSPMAYVQFGAATITATTTVVYSFFMLTLAFRPDRPPDLMRLLNDLAWLPFVGVWSPGALQASAVAIAVLSDKRPEEERALPRWIGWLSVWMAFTSLSGSLVVFFTDGPFAWDGLIAFHVAANVFLGWTSSCSGRSVAPPAGHRRGSTHERRARFQRRRRVVSRGKAASGSSWAWTSWSSRSSSARSCTTAAQRRRRSPRVPTSCTKGGRS